MHRVDRLRQLGTASLVDATSVRPDILVAVVMSKCADIDQLAGYTFSVQQIGLHAGMLRLGPEYGNDIVMKAFRVLF